MGIEGCDTTMWIRLEPQGTGVAVFTYNPPSFRPWQAQLVSIEEHVWEDMAEVYSALGQWGDAVACAKKGVELGPYSPDAYHAQG